MRIRYLCICILLFSSSLLLNAQAPAKRLSKVFNEEGWTVPGLRNAHVKPGTFAHSKATSERFSYEVTVLEPGLTEKFYVVPIITVDLNGERIAYKQIRFKPTEIHRFEVRRKPYCLQVSGLIYSKDPQSKIGGYAGTIDLLYFDETGNGKWTVLDSGGLLVPEIPPPPAWAAKDSINDQR